MTMSDVLQLLATFYLIGLVAVSVHEYGHALAAVRFGGAVKSLNVGFGPILYSRPIKIGQTKTNLYFRLIILGGYVDIDKDSFVKFSRAQCVVVYLSGVLMNLLLAILAFAWISVSQQSSTLPQYVVSVEPRDFTGGKAALPVNTDYVLSSLKETANQTEWRFEPTVLTGKSAEDMSRVIRIDEVCSPDCEGMLQRLLGIKLAKAFLRESIDNNAAQKLVVLSINETRFGSMEAFQQYLREAARVSRKLSVQAICGNQFCNYEDDVSTLLAYQWQQVSVNDQHVASATMPLVSLPWVLALEVLREAREGSRIALAAMGIAVEESRLQYQGAFTRLAELYKGKGVTFSGWAIWILVINITMLVFNLIPFYGSDGYRILQILVAGRTKWHHILQQVFLLASIGLVAFFLLGLLGKYIITWDYLTSAIK
jgi:membrane-associated protease RseP (regulator of RpoE activity)